MANKDHLKIFRQGTIAWNNWRKETPHERADLHGANLSWEKLSGADFSNANLREANLEGADLNRANLEGADLNRANLKGANLNQANLKGANLNSVDLRYTGFIGANLSYAELFEADLSRADLCRADLHHGFLIAACFGEANLSGANLYQASLNNANFIMANLCKANLREAYLVRADLCQANLKRADLSRSNLCQANLVGTNLEEAILTGCSIYGISAWELKLDGAKQNDLIIPSNDGSIITVDNIEIAQFIYLLLNNEKIRDVIDTISEKLVLILGRFTDTRMIVLEALKKELRKQGYLPVLFTFEGPSNRDIRQTVSTLAHMARFVIADITDAKSVPAELEHIIPQLPSVPVQPLVLKSYFDSEGEYALFEGLKLYPWVLPEFIYEDMAHLLKSFDGYVFKPAEEMASECKRKLDKIRFGGGTG